MDGETHETETHTETTVKETEPAVPGQVTMDDTAGDATGEPAAEDPQARYNLPSAEQVRENMAGGTNEPERLPGS